MLSNDVAQVPEESCDTPATMPTDDRRGDFVPDGIGKECGMPSAGADFLGASPRNAVDGFAVVKKRGQCLPGQPDTGHDAQVVFGRDVKQPSWRTSVSADGIDSMSYHC